MFYSAESRSKEHSAFYFWLEIPMEKKNKGITIFSLILFQVGTKAFWRAEF